MMKVITKSYLILTCIISMFMFSSCDQEELILEEGSQAIINSEDIILNERRETNCSIDYNDIDINIDWADDCSSATVTLSLCCDCLFLGGPETGCTLQTGVLEMQTQTCPGSFELYEQNIPWYSIQAGTCHDIVFEVDNSCDNNGGLFITQLFFNGDNLAVDYDPSLSWCP